GLIDEAKDIKNQADRAGCPWGTSSTDLGFVGACNKEGARLMGLMEEVRKQHMSLQSYANELDRKQTELSNTVVKLAQQKSKVDSDLTLLNLARQNWSRRYREFLFQSPTYERL